MGCPKGQNAVTVVIYFAISAAAITILLTYSSDIFGDLRSAVAVDQAENALHELNKKIQEVARGGIGSRRSMSISLQQGSFSIEGEKNKITYVVKTDAEIVSPRTTIRRDGVIIGSNAEVNAFECPDAKIPLCSSVSSICNSGSPCFVMENKHLRVAIKKLGSLGSPVAINDTDIIEEVYLKDTGEHVNPSLGITIDDDQSSSRGQGYTYLVEAGYDLGKGEVRFYVRSDYKVDYEMALILESEADFISLETISAEAS